MVVHMGQYTIASKTRTTWHHNPISGHWWMETSILNGYEVSGGLFFTTSHRTYKAAENEVAIRKSLSLLLEAL